MKFELFVKYPPAVEKSPAIALHRNGDFSINPQAWALMERPETVQLLWAAEEEVVGLRPCAADAPSAYTLRLRRQTAGADLDGPWTVPGKAFTSRYGIDITEGRRFRVYVEEGVLCFKISEGVVVSSSNARPAVSAPPKPSTPPAADRAARSRMIREWAVARGLLPKMSPGRIPNAVVDAYEQAQAAEENDQ